MSWIWMFYWYWSHMIICKGEHRSFLHAWASTWICLASKKSSPISPGLVRCERKFQAMIILIKVIQNVCVIACQRHFVLRNQHNYFFFYLNSFIYTQAKTTNTKPLWVTIKQNINTIYFSMGASQIPPSGHHFCNVYGAVLYFVRIRFHGVWEAIQLRLKLLKVKSKLS